MCHPLQAHIAAKIATHLCKVLTLNTDCATPWQFIIVHMTLVVAAFNKSQVCVSTDTQLTNLSNPADTSEAVKSNYFYCKDGKFLAAYTGNDIYLEDGVHVADWITNLLAASDIREQQVAEIIQAMVSGLNEKYYYKRAAIDPLTILVVGWVFEGDVAKPSLFRITNCETADAQPKTASKQFEVYESHDKRGVIVKGSVKMGDNPQFDSKIKYVRKLLKTVPFADFRDTIGGALYDLNTIAHNQAEWGAYIGDKTMLSVIHKMGDGVDYWRFPSGQRDYMLPNFNNGTMSVKGLKVHNDPIEGGTITLDIKR